MYIRHMGDRMKKFISAAVVVCFIVWLLNAMGAFHGSSRLLTVKDAPQELESIQEEGIGAWKFIRAEVVKVSDGDTLEVKYKSREYKVRLLDVDTPESVKTGVPVQSYAKEASAYTKDMVLNKTVKLIFEKGLKDRYGRLLAHIFLEDGSYFNAMLVKNGFARVEIVSPNSRFSAYFHNLQEDAVKEKRGMWSLPEGKRPFIKNRKGDYIPSYTEDKKAS